LSLDFGEKVCNWTNFLGGINSEDLSRTRR